ncbi:MAG: ATP-binding protein [Methanocella sp.]
MKPVGIVRDVEENDVHFISSKKFKTGDFVSYQDRWVDPDRHVLCRVCYAQSFKPFPDELIGDSGIDPKAILEFGGLDPEDYGQYLITASVVGYFNDKQGEFKHPRTMPDCGESIYEAGGEILKHISKAGDGEPGSATIGSVLGSDVPVVLSVRDVVSQHLCVIASTGSGKSYTVGVLLEELMMPRNRAAVMVVDPHGEYTTLGTIANNPVFRRDDYAPLVRIYRKDNIKIKITELELGDFLGMLDLSDKMREFFVRAFRAWRSGKNHKKSDLLREIENLGGNENNDSTINAITWRFQGIMNSGIIDDYQHVRLGELFVPGQLTVLDLSGIGESDQQLITSVLLRLLFDAREGTVNQRFSEGQERYLPYPAFVVLEEAHRYAPQNGEAKSKSILKTILSEGRKFGIGVCMVSQRPSKLDSDSLSQCMTQITMRIINPVDQGQIAASIETMSRELLDELPALAKGEAIISGVAVNTPVLTRIRERLTPHGGTSRDAPGEWAAQWKKANATKKAAPVLTQKEYKLF